MLKESKLPLAIDQYHTQDADDDPVNDQGEVLHIMQSLSMYIMLT